MGDYMENENNVAASAADNAAATGQTTDTGNGDANATATADNNQAQSTDNNAGAENTGAGDQGSNSQDNNSNANQSNANEEVDYSTLVPEVTINYAEGEIPDPVADPAGYAQFLSNDQDKRAQFRNSEIKGWQTLEKEFPEIKGANGEQLRKNILASRLYDAQNGGNKSLTDIGREVMAPYSTAHANGKTDAQVSITEQENAGLNNAGQPRQNTGKPDLLTEFRRGNVEAGRSMVEQMLKDGKI